MADIAADMEFAEEFRSYLSWTYDNPRVVSDCLSRCRRVQKFEGDLWRHYQDDRGQLLLDKLTYTLEDVQKCMKPKHSIPIKGTKGLKSVYEGTQSLMHSVNKYFEFLSLR
ncbi:hypothetical protein [Paenibacillus sp. FSL E2-0190]|uniref:hypothetical protein n=1 Tax=Paenibacillus sp. FSL E2-0190 TaxID=2954504 RepID=UPI0030EB7709